MPGRSRDAVATIKGYYYQFDYYIIQFFHLQNDNDSVRIEGIEDIDVLTEESTKAIQCKYYEGTNCTPSVIGKALRPMLRHFSENKDNSSKYKYNLYGHYQSGVESITVPLTVEYIKQHFFTYTEQKEKHELHKELGLSDSDLTVFLKRLELQLNAKSYESQIDEIVRLLQNSISCSEFDAKYFYYNNAVSFVKEIAVKKTLAARTISKKAFFDALCKKRELFDKWYIEYIGFENYYKVARKEFFTKTNISPMHRFFLLECDKTISNMDLAEIITKISEKWSKLSPRERTPFCPYIYIQGLTPGRLAIIKSILLENDFHVWDGYEYKDASFSPKSLARAVSHHIGVKIKIINEANQISSVIEACNGQKSLYQFYISKPFYNRGINIGHDFQIQKTSDVLKII